MGALKPYQQTLLAGIPTLLALMLFSPRMVVVTFMAFGYAHFAIAYFYQYRSGRVGTSFYIRTLLGVIGIVLFLWVTDWSLGPLMVITAIGIQLHFSLDELFLANSPIRPMTFFAIVPLLLLYPSSVADKVLGTSLVLPASVIAVLSSVVYLVWALRQRPLPYGGLWGVLFGTIFLLVISVFNVSPEKLIGSLVLFHYARWVVYSASKYWHTPRFAPFARDMVIAHGLAATLLCWYWFAPGVATGLLALVFGQFTFYILTLLHIITTGRASDYQGFLGSWVPSFGLAFNKKVV